MIRTNGILGLGLMLAVAACSDSTTTNPDASVSGQNDGGTTSTPSPPTLGALIDKMGRPGVNTAVTDPFDTNAAMEDMKKDQYNTTPQDSAVAMYKAPFAASIAVYDGLDRNCGNQFAAGAAGAGRYDALAGVLADDRLYLNTGAATCTTYLGVEANATGIIPNADCGGRAPSYDVIDVTYSVLAIGAVSGVDDGIANDSTFSGTFPFLAAPN